MKKLLALTSMLLATAAGYAQHTLINANFESDTPGWLYTGFKYSYTDGFLWNATLAGPNNLAFYNGSATSYLITADPLDAGNKVFYVDGFVNLIQDGGTRGMFFMKLDFTAGGAYTPAGGLVKVSYSFRMLRVAEDLDSPTQWQVSWISWYDNPDSAILEPGSSFTDKTVVKTFSTSGNRTNWVTVEGSFLADLTKVDTSGLLNTAIKIEATDGGFVSGEKGVYYLDDVLLTISQGEVVETPTWAGFDIVDEAQNVDTTPWLGWVNVAAKPWIYSYSLNGWMFIDEGSVAPGGGSWVYIPQ